MFQGCSGCVLSFQACMFLYMQACGALVPNYLPGAPNKKSFISKILEISFSTFLNCFRAF